MINVFDPNEFDVDKLLKELSGLAPDRLSEESMDIMKNRRDFIWKAKPNKQGLNQTWFIFKLCGVVFNGSSSIKLCILADDTDNHFIDISNDTLENWDRLFELATEEELTVSSIS